MENINKNYILCVLNLNIKNEKNIYFTSLDYSLKFVELLTALFYSTYSQ